METSRFFNAVLFAGNKQFLSLAFEVNDILSMTYQLTVEIRKKLALHEKISKITNDLSANPVPVFNVQAESKVIHTEDDQEMSEYKAIKRSRKIGHLLNELYFLEGMQNTIYSSIILNTYSQFEHTLNKICSIYKNITNAPIEYKDIHGNGIERAVLYLSKLIHVQQLKEGTVWQQLSHWNKIRNCLAHKDGILNQPSEIQAATALGLNTISSRSAIDGESIIRVVISPDSIEQFLQLIDQFMEKCIDETILEED
ncbi:hypothetical protein [Brevibacillus choshinensis]|uniref:hypothetical protein n=1 Tax=Brevibacillus choshinensis TaxID=54911 RepID=UPI002E1BD242|nr:hypothetical protein [Brevibacillus choshinensis]